MTDEEDPRTWPEETIPMLHVEDAAIAVAWYRRLGFTEEWTHRFEPGLPAFVSVRRGEPGPGVRLFLSEHLGDARPHGSVYLRVADVGPIAEEFNTEVHDAGSRLEVRLADPDGNGIVVGSPSGGEPVGYTAPAEG